MTGTTATLSSAQTEALSMFVDEARVESIDIDGRTRKALVALGLLRETTHGGTEYCVLTAEGRKRMSEIAGGAREATGDDSGGGGPTDAEVEFFDMPPGKTRGTEYPEPTYLRARPGKWAVVFTHPEGKRANSQQSTLRKLYGALGYKFVQRKHEVYGSYDPASRTSSKA